VAREAIRPDRGGDRQRWPWPRRGGRARRGAGGCASQGLPVRGEASTSGRERNKHSTSDQNTTCKKSFCADQSRKLIHGSGPGPELGIDRRRVSKGGSVSGVLLRTVALQPSHVRWARQDSASPSSVGEVTAPGCQPSARPLLGSKSGSRTRQVRADDHFR